MSYREHAPYGSVVVCDCCGKVGAIGDRDWRQVRGSSVHDAMHLCRACRGERYGVTCIKPITCRKRFIADRALRAAGCLPRRWRGTSTTARRVVVNAGSLSRRRRRRTVRGAGRRVWSWRFPWRLLQRRR
jgi:hypothetical protein